VGKFWIKSGLDKISIIKKSCKGFFPMRLTRWLLLCLSIFLLTGCLIIPLPIVVSDDGTPDRAGAYGQKVTYAEGNPIQFSDFTLTFRGVRHQVSDNYPRGFNYYEFSISRQGKPKTVAWSSGTGEIGATLFSLEGNDYQLELVYSDRLGHLADNELVIWKLGQDLPPTPTPAPTPTVHYEVVITIICDQMTPAAVEAILGEPVGNDGQLLNFFCLSGSQAQSDQPAPDDFPIYLADFGQRQVVAATQWGIGDEPDPLLEVAGRIRKAHPDADEAAYNKLLTYYAAGLYAEAFAQLPPLAEGAAGLHVTPVTELGQAAIWLWQDLPDGRHFATLLTVTEGKYVILYALTNAQRAEEPARTAAIDLVREMAE
jgi:hypothetical protein